MPDAGSVWRLKEMAAPPSDEASIFLAARQMGMAQARRTYLEQASGGNIRLLGRLEALLKIHDEDKDFLAAASDEVSPTALEQVAEGPGSKIGRYRLIEVIGEGGFGNVFLAEQQHPIVRPVALKIVKPGMDTREVVARFESERQALALMDHANIAQILDGGETASGRPYFVMELVRGEPITEYCDRKCLPARERLELFVVVCRAVQHAHQKGVIHRDIKPSNVMVAVHEGVPIVKVIDFGVAKAIGQQLTNKTLLTGHGKIIGTPAYMSPEQAQMTGIDIDTRSDIYSLGVLLYELLTGTTPIESSKLRHASVAEMQRLIQEEEPPRPSARVTASSTTATSIAAKRGTSPSHLARFVSGDLDWIVMKALEKDCNRRYATALGLCEDIERYLRREPILARPPSALYRLGKFSRRHRSAMLSLAAVAVASILGAMVAVWQAVEATKAKHDALAAAAAERIARDIAEARERETGAVLEFVQKRVLAAARPKGQEGGLGREVTLRRAVEASLPFVSKSFADQPLIEARLRVTLGDSFRLLGEPRIAVEQYQKARAIYSARLGPDHPDTLMSMHGLASAWEGLGKYQEAFALRQETLKLRQQKLGPDHPDTLETMSSLAGSYSNLGRYEDALELDQKTLALRKAKLGADHPQTIHSMSNLALDYSLLGRFTDALKLQEEVFRLAKMNFGPEHANTLVAMINLGNTYADLHRYADAVALRQETLRLEKSTWGSDHPHTLTTMQNLANTYGFMGRYSDALKLHQETLDLRRSKLGADHSDTLKSMWGVASNLIKLGRGKEALPVMDNCLERAIRTPGDPRIIPGVLDTRFRYFENAKDVAGCRQSADLWEKLRRTDSTSLYTAAAYRAVLARVIHDSDKSPDAAKLADVEADRAMDWLNKAVAAGFSDKPKLLKDKDFQLLKDRADFHGLLTAR
jgi:serine/threonine protein kinase/tetratricopeptide (TPR) repeat protein